MSAAKEPGSESAPPVSGQSGSSGPPSQYPDYSAAYAAYYQTQTAGYGQYGVNAAASNAVSGQPPAPNPYPGYNPSAPYGAYPPQPMYPPNPVPAPTSMSNAAPQPQNGSAQQSPNQKPPDAPQSGASPAAQQPYYQQPQAPYNNNMQPPQNYYNYGPPAPPPPGPYGPPNQYPPPSPYANQYNNPPPPPGGYHNAHGPPPPHNQGFFNRPPVRPYHRGNANQPPAWTNDPGTIKVEGFPTDITLDELRSTFNVGALKKDQYSGYDHICVSPDRQCAFLSFEDPTVAEAAVVMLNESSIRGQKIAVQIYDGNYHNQGFKRRYDDNNFGDSRNQNNFNNNFDKRPRFDNNSSNNHSGGNFHQNNFRDRGPNWPCIACNASNHGHRWNCYKCRAPKPDLDKNGPAPHGVTGSDPNFPSTHNRTVDDWICASCNNHNFAKRLVCNRCKLPKPANPTLAPMTGANNTPVGSKPSFNSFAPPSNLTPSTAPTWNCEPCGTSNEMTKLMCVKCQKPKPGIPQKTLDVLNKLNAIKANGGDQAANGQSGGSRWSDN